MDGLVGTEDSVTVTNVPYALYDVYIYADASNSFNQTQTLSITDGTTTFYYSSTGPNSAATNLLLTTSTDPSNPTAGPAQYQLFSDLTGSSFTATAGGGIQDIISNNLYGLQIVEVPAPAPVLGSGLSGLAVLAIFLLTREATLRRRQA